VTYDPVIIGALVGVLLAMLALVWWQVREDR
jgi:hypothetical protein